MRRAGVATKAGEGGGQGSPAFLAVLVMAQMGTSCDNGLVGLAAAELVSSLDATMADVQLATTVYACVAGAFMIAGGMVGVVVGMRRTLRLGLALAVLGEAVLVCAPNMAVFSWAGRLVVGVGASLVTPSVLGMVPVFWRGRKRTLAFGAISAGIALSSLLSLPLAVLMDAWGFRATFGLLAGYFALVLVATCALPRMTSAGGGLHFDFKGLVVAATGLALFLLGVSKMSSWGPLYATHAAPISLGGFSPAIFFAAAGLMLLVALVPMEKRIEQRHGFALLPQSFIGSPAVMQGLLAVMLPYFVMGSLMIIMVPYVQLVAGFTAFQTSVVSLLMSGPMLVFSVAFPRVFPRLSIRSTIRSGFVMSALGTVAMGAGFTVDGVSAWFFAGLVLVGVGLGTVNSQANNSVASSVDLRDAEQSGGIQGTARNVGTALGSAMLGTVLLVFTSAALPSSIADSASIPQDVRAEFEQLELSFVGDDDMRDIIGGLSTPVEQEAADAILAANEDTRFSAARLSMGLLSGVIALSVLATRHLPRCCAEKGEGRAKEEG